MNNKYKLEYSGFEVAVIGMAGKFPDAEDINEFWNNLIEGKESIESLTYQQLTDAGLTDEIVNKPNFVKCRVRPIQGKQFFDNGFFGFNVKDSDVLDPQIRLLHEYVWNALEDAGYAHKTKRFVIGLFAGATSNTFWEVQSIVKGNNSFFNKISSNKDFLSTLVSHNLNLIGPSVMLNTACSTSLVAVHMAYQSILNGECDLAIAAGVNIHYDDDKGYLYQEGMIKSQDGHNRTFDTKASGTIGGEGIGVVVLKKMENAIQDRDNIYSIIKGSAINNDGDRKVGYTAPSVEGQIEVIKMCQQVSEVNSESIAYVEAHGTATQLGDVVEFDALKSAFETSKKAYCGLGSVKSNIGHLNTAAGIAGFIKCVLVLKHRQIPPTLHFEVPNPKIDVINSPFYINSEINYFSSNSYPFRTAVSSFGIGGTNAHTILEEYNVNKKCSKLKNWYCLPLSARSPDALNQMKINLLRFIEQNPNSKLGDIAYTLQTRRKSFNYRTIVICQNKEEISNELLEKANVYDLSGKKLKPVFYFHNNIPIDKGVINGLYKTNNKFKKWIDELCLRYSVICDIQILEYFLFDNTRLSLIENLINDKTDEMNCIAFTIQYSLAKFLVQQGIIPYQIVGEWLGEIVALCIANSLSFENGVKLVKVIQNTHLTNDCSSFIEFVKNININSPEIPIYSTSLEENITLEKISAIKYWKNLFEKGSSIKDHRFPEVFNTVTIHFGISTLDFSTEKNDQNIQNFIFDPLKNSSDEKFYNEKIGEMWLKGLDIKWGELLADEVDTCISLPTYPFEKKKFNANIKELNKIIKNRELHGIDKTEDYTKCAYIPVWKERKTKLLPGKKIRLNTDCLVFINKTSLCKNFLSEFKLLDLNIVVVLIGECFVKRSRNEYVIEPGSDDDYKKLMNELLKDEFVPNQIYHLWSLIEEKSIDTDMDSQIQDRTFYSLLGLAKGINQFYSNEQIEFNIITNNLFKVFDDDIIVMPERATIIGTIKVISVEYNNINTHCLDFDLYNNIDSSIISEQISRLRNKEIDGQVEVIRNRKNFIEDYEPLDLSGLNVKNTSFKENGVYLITGGIGGIGKEIASYLGNNNNIKLILIGRTELPEKKQWDNWLSTHNKDDVISEKINTLKSIEQKGGNVIYYNIDVSNYIALKGVIAESELKYGDINGVLHCAGKPDGVLIKNRTKEITEDIFSSKYYGTLALCLVFKEKNLDFFILFSSLNSIIGIPGQAGYTASNIFLDRYADYFRQLTRLNIKSINWDQWSNTGMAKVVEQMHKLNSKEKLDGLLPKEAINLLELALSIDINQIIISKQDIRNRKLNNYELNPGNVNDFDDLQNGSLEYDKRPQLSTELIPPSNDIEIRLAKLIQNYIGIKEVGIKDNLFELGIKSLDIIQLAIQINKEFNKYISVVDMYSYSSIEKLSSYLICQNTSTSFNSLEKARIEKKVGDSRSKLKQRKNFNNAR